jgi:hypothetical protein
MMSIQNFDQTPGSSSSGAYNRAFKRFARVQKSPMDLLQQQ